MKLKDLGKYKRILILGYGKEGQSTERYLKSALPDVCIDHTDKTIDLNYLEKQKEYDLIIKTPGISKAFVTQTYTTATNIFFANCTGTVIGVTGTKGKSTTSSLIYHILKEAGKTVHLVGNIGTSALSVLINSNGKDDIFVMELSSYQLDDIKFSPHISVILNLFPEHMNYHGNVTNYFSSKKNIIRQSRKDDYLVFNPNYKELDLLAHECKCTAKPFLPRKIPLSEDKLSLKGDHNKENIQAAIAVAEIFSISQDTIKKALNTFKPLPHRLEKIGTYRGITFYDDAISTTPESTIAALKTLPNVDTIFLGGEDRGYDFSRLVEIVFKHGVSNIVLFPDTDKKIGKLLQAKPLAPIKILLTDDMLQAVRFAYANTKVSHICLLSTAAPSYSVWKNFEEKGDLFKLYVRKYEKG